jgi:dolichol-phosphate mannosyltransferase
MIRFALDALTGFSSAPLKLASHAGLWLSFGSVVIVLYILAGWLSGRTVPGWTSLMLVVVVLGAIQMFVLALMGEYIGRLYNEAKRRPLYIVQEIAGRAGEPRAGLGVIASSVGPAAVKGEGHERGEDDVGDDRPPRRAV